MISARTAAAVRAAEAPLLAAGRGPELMRLAAHGLAMGIVGALRARGCGVYGSRVVLLVGPGNNGGDTLFAGAWLAARGTRTTALLTGARTHPEALAAFRRAGGRYVAEEGADRPAFWDEASGADVVVDGLLGTGGRGGLRGAAAVMVARLQDLEFPQRPLVVACDLPSGVDASTGEVHGPVLRADVTVTFGAYKSGLLAAPGEQFAGTVRLIDLGLSDFPEPADVFRLEPADLADLLPRPASADHKYTRGVAGIVAGSARYPGAALLAVAAASACGPGMVRYLGPAGVAGAVHVRNPEVVCSEESPAAVRVQAWLAGPGIDDDAGQLARAVSAMGSGLPTVVDAGALALVRPAQGSENAHLVLTPHAGELADIFARASGSEPDGAHAGGSQPGGSEPGGSRAGGGQTGGAGAVLDRAGIEASPLAAARRAAELLGAVVLLKGATTVVAAPDGTVFTQANGNPRLATAGSGDTLAGILVALLAMGVGRAGAGPGPAGPGPAGPGDAGQVPPPPRELARTAALAAALHGELSRADPGGPLNAGQLAGRIPLVWAQMQQIDQVCQIKQRRQQRRH